MLRIAVILFALVLSFRSAAAETGSDLSIRGSLYENGRPQTGERGGVRDFTSWNNFLFASWTDLDGDFWLDTWDLSKIESPQSVESHYFGNINDDAGALIPVAHLKAPRDLGIVDGHLVLWSSLGVNIYPLSSDGTLGALTRYAPNDRDTGVNRIRIVGNYAATEKRRLSEAEVNALIAGGTPLQEIEAMLTGIALLNLQAPTAPFPLAKTQAVGASLLTFDEYPIGTIEGFPAIASLAENNLSISITRITQPRSVHFDAFWKPKLKGIFNTRNYSRSFERLKRQSLPRAALKDWQQQLLADLAVKLRISSNTKLEAAILRRYDASVSLLNALDDFSIEASDSLSLVVQKIALKLIPDSVSVRISKQILTELATRWRTAVFSLGDKSPDRLRRELTAAMNAELEDMGLSRYLVRRILAPLVDAPPEILITLGELINLITSSSVAQVIDVALSTFHEILTPIEGLLSLVEFEAPNCLAIPRSSKALLELLLIDSGPKLDRSELALFELLRLVQYYLGSSTGSDFLSSLRSSIRELHTALAGEVIASLSKPLAGAEAALRKVSQVSRSATLGIDLKPFLARIVAQPVLKALQAKQIDITISFEEFIEIQSSSLRVSSLNTASVGDLVTILEDLRVANITLGSIYDRASKQNPAVLQAALYSGFDQLLDATFGLKSAKGTLGQAIESLVVANLDARNLASFIDSTIGRALTERNSGTSFPDIIGVSGLSDLGDCVSAWRYGFIVAESIAIASPVPFIQALSPPLLAIEIALQEAVDAAIGYVISSLIQEFLAGVFQSAAQNYPTWYANPQTSPASIDISGLSLANFRFSTLAASRDTLAAIFRDVGASLPDSTRDSSVKLVRLKPSDPLSSIESVTVGQFALVNAVLPVGNHFLIVGSDTSSFFGNPLALLVDFTAQEVTPRRLSGDLASLLSASSKAATIQSGRAIAVLNGAEYIAILQ